jgi:hypothetical protein
LSQGPVPGKMTTKVEGEEVAESKNANPVKQRIKWLNVVLLIFIHLMPMYLIIFEIRRINLKNFIWCRYRLDCTLYTLLYPESQQSG